MSLIRFLFVTTMILVASQNAYLQTSEACSEIGGGSIWLDTRAVYGRVVMNGLQPEGNIPKVTVALVTGARVIASTTLDRSGKYCFKDVDGSGGTLILEVENVEVGRQNLPLSSGSMSRQFQQDFEIWIPKSGTSAKPGIVSAKFRYPRKPENATLFEESNTAIKQRDSKKAIQLLKKIVATDPNDFLAWTQLGSIQTDLNEMSAAEEAYRKALVVKPDFGVAMMYLGRLYLLQNKLDLAIQTLLKATEVDPTSARSFRLLGEGYLLSRKGTLGVEALNEAIRLEPIEMADGHLLMARLYDIAGAKPYASREYRLFLEKVPKHPDAKRFAKYIEDNPEVQK